MGCDIHLYAEVRKGGKWYPAGKPVLNCNYDMEQDFIVPWHLKEKVEFPETAPLDNDEKDKFTRETFYYRRNYGLFAILADVRNFNKDPLEPIFPPRGVPVDASDEYKELAKGVDWHSHSYLTLKEILEFDWTKKTTDFIAMSLRDYYNWHTWQKLNGDPPYEYQYVSLLMHGYDQKNTIKEQEALEIILKFEKEAEGDYKKFFGSLQSYGLKLYYNSENKENETFKYNKLVACKIDVPYYRIAEKFWSETIPRLLRLGPPEDVRIVFFFDN